MGFDFNAPVDRRGSHSVKYDLRAAKFGVEDALPLWVADMDLPTLPALTEALIARAAHPIYGYTLAHEDIYAAIIDWQRRRHGWAVSRDWITLTPNVVQGLALCVQALTRPGEGVVTFTPVYDPITGVITRNGRTLQRAPLRLEAGRYRLDRGALEAALTPSTRLLLLCSPHNPTGRVWRAAELDIIAEIAQAHELIIVSDEIHADLVFAEHPHTPVAHHSPELAARSVTLSSPGKTFNTPGLMAAYAITPDAGLRARLGRIIEAQYLHGPNLFGLVSLEVAYREGEAWYQALIDHLRGNIQRAAAFTRARLPGVTLTPPEATYLLWLDMRGLGLPPAEIQRRALHEAGLALTPGEQYGPEGLGFMRMNVGMGRPILEEALRRLERAFGAEARDAEGSL
ncbi:PatB family C-S lyase [Myxococcota bacterium]|nr:PatB family C-S lyase [Myxococcota bacterium]MBU1432028.1 PatB family C-S lyase [Myxococcota bacterium]MBU1899682.1 PatB family C-S lyase [Myxococcota bacterium]